MIQEETDLEVGDNSGARRVRCFRVLGGSKCRSAGVGDVIVCSVKEASPRGNVKKKQIVRGVVVRTKRVIRRKDGSSLRFDVNSVVLIDERKNPIGTAVFGPVAREVSERGFAKICSLAPEVV